MRLPPTAAVRPKPADVLSCAPLELDSWSPGNGGVDLSADAATIHLVIG
ncbi:hypothetical protein [Nocardia brasiliensis]|nr:hypothetical protein [Nocardia brasiliensis]MBF6126285.1 hypothetical protein [Nocardia brasiliensis]